MVETCIRATVNMPWDACSVLMALFRAEALSRPHYLPGGLADLTNALFWAPLAHGELCASADWVVNKMCWR